MLKTQGPIVDGEQPDLKVLFVSGYSETEAVKRIDSNIDEVVPASWGVAGGIRNAGYVLLNMVTFGTYADPTDPEFANRRLILTTMCLALVMVVAGVRMGVPMTSV